ncbi:hypothetical protein ACOSQ3_007994 [Xanthoceras sorbifolium]
MMTTTTSQVLKINREKLVACMTCPLCKKLFRDATTVSECLHTFCRKCIYDKIMEDDLDSCPVCNIDLGCVPLEKLRADNNLKDIRLKIFPSKRHNSNAPEAVSSVLLPPRRKERSLSSLVISTPKSHAKFSLTGRRLKPGPRKNPAVQESTFPVEEPVKDVELHQASLSSPQTLSELAQDKGQIPFTVDTSNQQTPDKDTEVEIVPLDGKADLWKPLNSLVEAASKTKSNKSNTRGTVATPVVPDACDNETCPKARVKEGGNASKVHGNENDAIPAPSGSVKPRKYQTRQKRTAVSEGLNVPAQAIVDTNSKCDERFGPTWVNLVASGDQEGYAPLPQIPSSYLRIKDGSLPVSFIQKYIAKKLNLASEAEVEISLQGQPVLSTLQLHNLIDRYVQTASSERIQTSVGNSARDFVMVLSYGRKAQPPQTYFKNAYSHHLQQ